MCDESCFHQKPDRKLCEACRTINLLPQHRVIKPPMQIYDKCNTVGSCMPNPETPVHPEDVRVWDREDVLKRSRKPVQLVQPPGPGKMMYAIKAGIVATTLWFTYKQGVWGDQRASTEAARRLQEYTRRINKRTPVDFDPCGKVIIKDTAESLIAPLYAFYKHVVTSFFTGIYKFPAMAKCFYFDYMKQMKSRKSS